MPTDVDSLLLDRMFQPVADRMAGRVSCFGLARWSLASAVLLQLLMLTVDLHSVSEPMQRVASASVTLLMLFGAERSWALIARTERQVRCGGLNVRRVSLRWQRLAWLAVTMWSFTTGISIGGQAGFGLCGASLAWLGLIYFVSCTPVPPRKRTAPHPMFA